MNSLITAVGIGVIAETFKQLTTKVFEKDWPIFTDQGKRISNQFFDPIIREQYIEKILYNQLHFRTLSSPESDVYIDNVYYPIRIKYSTHSGQPLEYTIDNDFKIEYMGILNIIGLAGQGKSTVMRKFILEESRRAKRMPIFLELKRVKAGDILTSIMDMLKTIGIKITYKDLELLLMSKKIVLILDGFDEIHPDLQIDTLDSINSIHIRLKCPIVITSRPGSYACNCAGVLNANLQFLNKNEVIHLLKKLAKPEEHKGLVRIIKNNPSLIEAIQTPILVSLFYVCYPHWDEIPTNTQQFYSKLFSTLYTRHDELKNTPRYHKAKLDTIDAVNAFSTICFEGIKNAEYEFGEERLLEIAKISVQKLNLQASAQNVIKDIVEITNLIKKDGFDKFVFLHKSIQEYHAARYIQKLVINEKIDIYTDIYNKIESSIYDNVILFLKNIDNVNYRHYLLEYAYKNNKLNLLFIKDSAYTLKIINSLLKNTLIYIDRWKTIKIEYIGESTHLTKIEKIAEILSIPITPLKIIIDKEIIKNNSLSISQDRKISVLEIISNDEDLRSILLKAINTQFIEPIIRTWKL